MTGDPRYSHPPEGPDDITPADDVHRYGDEVVIVHGPGEVSRIDADEFYDDNDADSDRDDNGE